MNDLSRIRATIALLVVGVFMGITAVMALWPLFSHTEVELDKYADFLSKIASVYTGIIGVIVGYYFGQAKTPLSDPKSDEGDDRTSGH